MAESSICRLQGSKANHAMIQSLAQILGKYARELHPSSFAMVMATGIISIAAHLLDFPRMAMLLMGLNLITYSWLWAMTIVRIAFFRVNIVEDLLNHNRCVGYFTMAAGTCVVGSEFLVLRGNGQSARLFWFLGVALWGFLNYTIFTLLVVKEKKPLLAEGINGGWLIAVVATQSVANLGELVLQDLHPYGEWVHFFSLSLWLSGGMLYIWIISLIFYRYMFFTLVPSDFLPPYWVNMGAMAVSTLTGTTLIRNSPSSRLLSELSPFLKGFTILYWATATWWLPMLVILWAWRHVYKGFPLVYDPLYWGAVFPLGMYSVCTFWLANVLQLSFLMAVPRVSFYVALAAWAVTLIAFTFSTARTTIASVAQVHAMQKSARLINTQPRRRLGRRQ